MSRFQEIDGIRAGILVEFTNENGYETEREEAQQYFRTPGPYLVTKVEVGGWSSRIQVDGIPNKWFNSVMFRPWEGLVH